ncbi:MAG: TonB-dependent receptor [Candidatus Omnitrophica bacterium]|nr:TonB-dependent receptor [Candidatus Omnitrophota bacterium]
MCFKVRLFLIALILLLVLTQVSLAQAEKEGKKIKGFDLGQVVVSATRTETSSEYVASSITVITAEDIERKGQATVYDVLKDVPGISLKQCGGAGQYSTVRMRGGQDRHIKLMINGSSIGDPATGITQHYDLWNFLSTDDIERIEIIRGPQSALYGSDAISGIINIITKKGKGKPKSFVRVRGGSMDTWKVSGGTRGAYKGMNYNVMLSHSDAGGVLPHDEFEDDTISTNFGYQLDEDKELNLSLQYSDTMVNLGQSSTTKWKSYDDPHAYRYGHLFFSNLDFTQKVSSLWEHKLSLSYDRTSKTHDDPDDGLLDAADNINDSWSRAKYLGITKQVYWQNNFFLGKTDTLTAGVEYEDIDVDRDNESASSHKVYSNSVDTRSLYLQNQLLLFDESLSLICGGRLDDHSAFGDHTTYKLGSSYLIREYGTKLKATYGTGFAAPSTFQLFDPQYGTPGLNPEESKSWDVGLEQKLFGDKAVFETTYFHNDFENLIAYASGHYVNRDVAKSHGIETILSIFPWEYIEASVSYTFTDGEEDGKDLANVPENDWKLNLSYHPGKLKLSADFYYVGDRLAYDQEEEHRLNSYALVNVAASYQVNKNLNAFVQLENLLDEDYQSAARWEAPGFSAYGGMKIDF